MNDTSQSNDSQFFRKLPNISFIFLNLNTEYKKRKKEYIYSLFLWVVELYNLTKHKAYLTLWLLPTWKSPNLYSVYISTYVCVYMCIRNIYNTCVHYFIYNERERTHKQCIRPNVCLRVYSFLYSLFWVFAKRLRLHIEMPYSLFTSL